MVRFVFVVLFTATVFQHVVSMSVPEIYENYPCAGGLQSLTSEHGRLAEDCEQIWSIGSSPIGRIWNGSAECHRPCSQVTVGEIVVSKCVNITLTVLCVEDYMTEYRIHFNGINPSPQIQPKNRARYGCYASVAVLGTLLSVALVGLFHCYRSHHHGSRNTEVIQL
ncbi:hypothetical protein SRHO_G00057290 [Serrasalmus rhombeus]